MASRPPPLSPRSTPPRLTRSSDEALSSRSSSDAAIYAIAVSLFLLAILSCLVAMRLDRSESDMDQGANAPLGSTGEDSGFDSDRGEQPDRATVVDDVKESPASETSDTGLPTDASPMPDTETAESEQPSADVTEESEDPMEQVVRIPSIPLYQGKNNTGEGGNIGAISSDGKNPFLDSLEAKRIVLVIDRSASMSGNNLPRVIQALSEAIDHLQDDQEFLILFFNDSMTMHPELQKLAKATTENKRIAIQWMETIHPSGGTSPLQTMAYALAQQPNRIVMLSDGEFNPLVVDVITAENKKSKRFVRIDGVGLAETVQTLQYLARQNGGIYYQAR